VAIKIGVMDSGAGGLTIFRSIHAAIPHADISYFADQAYAPYGAQPPTFIVNRLIKVADYFINQGCQMMVVACNTATVAGIAELRSSVSIPIVGVEPAVKPACSSSRCKKVTVLATLGTSKSRRLNDLIDNWHLDTEVDVMASENLASLIDGMPESVEQVKLEVRSISDKIMANKSDTLVLACTHYPLIKEMFDEVMPDVAIVEPSRGVTAQVQRLMEDLLKSADTDALEKRGQLRIETNGSDDACASLSFWCQDTDVNVSKIIL
jgi:glutamate racemase